MNIVNVQMYLDIVLCNIGPGWCKLAREHCLKHTPKKKGEINKIKIKTTLKGITLLQFSINQVSIWN